MMVGVFILVALPLTSLMSDCGGKDTDSFLNNKKKTVKNVKTIVFAAEMIVYAGNLAIFSDRKDANQILKTNNLNLKLTYEKT